MKTNTKASSKTKSINQAITKTLNQKEYSKLLSDLKTLIENGRDKSQKNATNQLTITYWKIGQRISNEKVTDKSGYKNSIIKELTEELDLEKTILSRCVSFFKTYKTPPNNENLSWSHYKDLLGVKNEEKRLELEQQAQDEGWSRAKLLSAINQLNQPSQSNKSKLVRPIEATYLYKAKIIEVIDGDTLLLSIDLGFQVWKEQRIRLAEIDCPEINTKEGKKAFNYTREKLAQTDFIIIKTRKIDIYGRYVGHIFYSPNNTHKTSDQIFKFGNYLNEDILKEGLAVRF